jgi:hypothetical protein
VSSTLTTAQKISLFHILGIPYASSYTVHDGMGTDATNLGAFETYSTIKTEVDTFLDSISSDIETAIKALITPWDSISLQSARMDAGGVSGISGVTIDYDRQRALIQERMENLVPYIARWRAAVRQSASGPNTTSLVMWS